MVNQSKLMAGLNNPRFYTNLSVGGIGRALILGHGVQYKYTY